jgi:predicted GNAT family acetyltransferase
MHYVDTGSLMETKQFRKYIDDSAYFYIRMIADAKHMEIIDNGIYEMARSRGDVNSLCVVYNIRLDHLSDEEIIKAIKEIRELKVHTWWPHLSERVLDIMHGKGKRPAWSFDDTELYGTMLPEEMPRYPRTPSFIQVRRVRTKDEFKAWCEIDNRIEHGGNVHIHPQNHYHLLKNGKLRCYLGYVNGVGMTTAAILNNEGTASLAFTVTTPENRQKGYAKAVCQFALKDAFKAGIKIVSVAAIGDARMLGRSLGFKYDAPSGSIWSFSYTGK